MKIYQELLFKESKQEKIAGITYAIVAILQSLALFHSDSTLGARGVSSVLINFIIVFFLISIIFFVQTKSNNQRNSYVLLLSVVVMAALTLFNRFAGLNENRFKISFVMQVLFLSTFCFYNNRIKLTAFLFYKKFLVITSLLGIICFISFLLNLGLPYSVVPFYDSDAYVYIDYKIAYLTMGSFGIRLCGLFNEPGYLGTFCALYLSAHRMNISNWENAVLFIAGCLSFSFAFYIIIIISWLLYYIKNDRKRINILISIIFFFIIFLFVKNIPQVSHLIERFDFANGELIGDNRTSHQFDIIYESFLKSGDIFWGMGYGYKTWLEDTGISSYKEIIIQFGIVGSILMWSTLLIAALNSFSIKKSKYIFIFVFCFMASIYQRPNIYSAQHFIILFGGINYLIYSNLSKLGKC